MRIIYNILSVFVFAARRLWHNLGLMIGTALGLIVAVAFVMSVPIYADSVNYRLMARALADENVNEVSPRPPYAFMFRYIGSWYGAVDWASYQNADRYFVDQCPSILGLPLEQSVRYVKTDNLRVYPAGLSGYSDPKLILDRIGVGFIDRLNDHIRLVEGRFPVAQTAGGGGPLEVLVTEDKANELGIVTGEDFVLLGEGSDPAATLSQIPAKVVGIWRARSYDDVYWFYQPASFDGVFLTTEASFASRVVPAAKKPVYLALWYLIFDGRGVHTEDVSGFLSRVTVATTMADKSLAKTSLDISPVNALAAYVESTLLLTILLFVFAIPIVGLVLYFMILTTNLVVQRQRNEIAVLRSRGMSALQVVRLYLLEGLILGAVAIAVGPLIGQLIAYIMGTSRSFLSFTLDNSLTVSISQQSLRLGFVAVVVALVSTMLPALGAARHTIVTYKQDIARSLDQPWWQKLYLDILLLAVPLYGYYLLRQRGTLSILGQTVSASEGDPFSNPLLFLVPTLFVFGLALLFLRVFPVVMSIVARLFEFLPGTSLLLAVRQLARSWGYYTGPLLLIILTMGLACFTASMARTLDAALIDQTYYDVGADLRLVELGDASEESNDSASNTTQAAPGAAAAKPKVYWYFMPVAEHLKVDGVQAAARFATFSVSVRLGQSSLNGKLVGIDRLDYPRAGFFRRDFAPASLGALVNYLARDESAVLVPRSFLGKFGLSVGDTFVAELNQNMTFTSMPFTIEGVIDLFPTMFPSDGTYMVANLEYIHEQMGGPQPYDVLLKVAPGSKTETIISGLADLSLRIIRTQDTRLMIENERRRPERQGILGLLSVGTLSASFLTVLGLSFYSLVSFRRRFIELGILRAIGLSIPQMVLSLGCEQFVLIASGVGAGTGFGVLASVLFIPFLQVRAGPHAQVPPFVVQMAWGDIAKVYVIFGAMLLVTVAGLVWLLMRMRIADAVKLGESV